MERLFTFEETAQAVPSQLHNPGPGSASEEASFVADTDRTPANMSADHTGADIRSQKTSAMYDMMSRADGKSSLSKENKHLFQGCEAWEKMVMVGCANLTAASLISDSLREERTQKSAVAALARVANTLQGVPGFEEVVALFVVHRER